MAHDDDAISMYQSYDKLSSVVDSLSGSTTYRIQQCMDNAVRSILICHCGVDERRYHDLASTVLRAMVDGRVDEARLRYRLILAVAAGIVPRHTLDMVWDDDDLLAAMEPMVEEGRVLTVLIPIVARHEPMLFRKMREMAHGG